MTTTAARVTLEKCPPKLSADHVARYAEEGYLAFENFLSPGEVDGINNALREIVHALLARAKSGELPVKRDTQGLRNYSGYTIHDDAVDFGLLLEPDAEVDIKSASPDEVENMYRKIARPTLGHPLLKVVREDVRLVSMLESLLGPNPIYYGDMALCKPPRIGVDKPWHQDAAYFGYEPYGHGVGVWIALDEAAVDNGCMFVLSGHHKLGPRKHVHITDCEIEPGRVDVSQATPIEMKPGGILLFSPMLPHYTPPNRSDQRRRALQIFYRAAHTKIITQEEHSRNFLEADGTPATCSAAEAAMKKTS